MPQHVAAMKCVCCKAVMPLFFKICLKNTAHFQDRHLLVFACVSCTEADRLIPDMVDGPLPGANIRADFLRRYQTNFRLLLLKEDECRENVVEVASTIRHQQLTIDAGGVVRCGQKIFGRVGGSPKWILEDESPGTCQGSAPFEFVFQLTSHWAFETVKDAPSQMTLNIRGKPEPAALGSYTLFIGNTCYFFATPHEDGWVYVLTQVD